MISTYTYLYGMHLIEIIKASRTLVKIHNHPYRKEMNGTSGWMKFLDVVLRYFICKIARAEDAGLHNCCNIYQKIFYHNTIFYRVRIEIASWLYFLSSMSIKFTTAVFLAYCKKRKAGCHVGSLTFKFGFDHIVKMLRLLIL